MILNQSISPCQDEVSVKVYQCTEFNSKVFGIKAKGYLEVTNKRLLFQALGKSMSGWSVIHNEVAIADVSEIKVYKGASFNVLMLIIGIILSLLGAAIIKAIFTFVFNTNTVGTLAAIAVFGYGVYWFYTHARREAFSLLINTKGGQGNVVNLIGMSPFAGNAAAAKALIATPSQESELMLKEIGAVVLDIQNMGENAIEKWKENKQV